MADLAATDAGKPWEGLSGTNIQVLDAAPQANSGQDAGKPWEGLGISGGRVEVYAKPPKNGLFAGAAAVTERYLDATPGTPDAKVNGAVEWTAQAYRAATFGLTDYLVAGVAAAKNGGSYQDALKATRQHFEANQSLSAEIVGSLAPGIGLVKVGARAGRLVIDSAARGGIVDGAMNWIARHPKLAWLPVNAAKGAGAGAAFEAVRTSVGQAISATAGEGFDGNTIIDAAIQGGIVGAIGAPIAQGALSGAGGLVQWAGATLTGGGKAQAIQAAARILRTTRLPEETPDATIARLRGSVQAYAAKNGGRQATLMDILPPEQVEDLTDVVRFFQGFDTVARKYAGDVTKVAKENLDAAARSGAPLKDTLELQLAAESQFGQVTREFGSTLVDVTPEALDALTRNKGWLGQQVSAGAKAVARVINAKERIGGIRDKMRRLDNAVVVSDSRVAAADLRKEIADLIDEDVKSGLVPESRLAGLRSMLRVANAKAGVLAQTSTATNTVESAVANKQMLRAFEAELAKFESEGLKITLSDANHMRATASRHAFRELDPGKADALRELNDALMTVGVAEVPAYGAARQMFSEAMTRKEAQALGEAAVRDTISPANLRVTVEHGLITKGNTVKPGRLPSLQQGAEEGAALEVSRAARGTTAEARKVADQIAGSPNSQESLGIVAPQRAARLIDTAGQSSRSLKNAAAVESVKSPSSLRAERDAAKQVIETGLFTQLGGAATAGLLTRALFAARLPRGTAKKVVEMLGDPNQMEQALLFMQHKGINLSSFFGAITAALAAKAN